MDDRIARIQVKLAALPAAEKSVLGSRLSEQKVSGFEQQYGIRMPEEFRQFITNIGHGGYGPTYGLLPMERWVSAAAGVNGRLAEPFPFVPDVTPSTTADVPTSSHLAAWSHGRHSGAAPVFPGAIAVVYRGCSDFTLLVVTGPGRGRLVEVNAEGFFVPHFHTDRDFLAWYERWLDFTLTGHRDLTWFADQMTGDEATLVATLLNDALATRRRAAACTFITYPTPSASLPHVLAQALSTEPHPAVKEKILHALSAQGERGRDRLPSALTDPLPDIRSLAVRLMTTNTPQGRRLSPHLRQVLGNHLRAEEDRSVRDTIQRMLDHSH